MLATVFSALSLCLSLSRRQRFLLPCAAPPSFKPSLDTFVRSVCVIDEQFETEAVSGQGTGQGTARACVKMYSRGEEAESVRLTQPLSLGNGKGAATEQGVLLTR